MTNINFMLVKRASGGNYSVEAGLHDGIKNWDHHPGSYEGEQPPSPANNPQIGGISQGVVEISHMDADTLLGIHRILGSFDPTGLDTALIERIDLNGSSVCSEEEADSASMAYMVGVGALARDIKFPRLAPGVDSLDVTEYVQKMIGASSLSLMDRGRTVMEKEEADYLRCKETSSGPVGLWAVGAEDSLDPSRPYKDGVSVVVVFRNHYKSISIYCDPSTPYAYGGQEVGGILFAGHPKACGSPRGQEFSLEDAQRVYQDLCSRV